ncbi:DUF4282 domain-containing protein [Bremerella cremea]|uniref:DUF4282 domain-containing protein n=1 Tax=Bremerella cremea TaxID=1031537 RepID=UPI0031E9C17A
MADEFFYKFNPTAPEVGPIDSKTLKQLAGSGAIQPESQLRRGTGDWVVASSVKGLFPDAASVSPPEAIPVEAPAVATPEAAPVAAPIASAGLNFPSLAETKSAPDVPSGLDSLVVAPKKAASKPVKKPVPPASKKTAAPPVAAPVVPAAEAATAEPVQPATPTAVAAPAMAASPKEVAAKESAANPFASDPKGGRSSGPRRKGTGGLGSLFNFDVLIGPTVIKALFFLVTTLILLGWMASTGWTFVMALATGEAMALGIAAVMSLFLLMVSLVYIIIARVMAEIVITFFQINENVRDMRDMMEEDQGVVS